MADKKGTDKKGADKKEPKAEKAAKPAKGASSEMAHAANEPHQPARLKDVYRKEVAPALTAQFGYKSPMEVPRISKIVLNICLLYTSDAADERSSVDLGGRRI